MKVAAAFIVLLCCLATSHGAFRCSSAPGFSNVHQIDAGLGHVVGLDRYKRPRILIGRYFYSLGSTTLKHVSTGPAGTWGCDRYNKVQKLVAGNWKVSTGLTMRQVDAGGSSQVVGLRSQNNLTYCVHQIHASNFYGIGSLSWRYLSIRLKYVSCGPNTCWGVAQNNQAYVARIAGTCGRTGAWSRVPGLSLKMIEVGTDGSVYGVATNGRVYQRFGATRSNYRGRSWRYIPMCMPIRHLSYDLRRLWVVTESNLLMVCTY